MTQSCRLLFLALAVSLLAGCASSRALRNDPNYRAGYGDGCATANNEGTDMSGGGTVRDDDLFRTDKAYRAGWSGGFSACRSSGRSAAPAPGAGPIPDPGIGGGGLPR